MSEPRSIRLNKSHREDIIEAVMANWDKQNPAPKGAGVHNLILDCIAKALSGHKRYASLGRDLKNAKKALEIYRNTPADLIKYLRMSQCETVDLFLEDSNGRQTYHSHMFIPKTIADDLGIPYYDTGTRFTRSGHESDMARDLLDGAEEYEYVSVVGSGRVSVVVKRDSPEYREYDKARKEASEHSKTRNRIKDEFEDYLNQFNTTKQIRDGWPELVDFLPAHLADPEKVIQLPAIRVSRLNERLGIK